MINNSGAEFNEVIGDSNLNRPAEGSSNSLNLVQMC